MDYGCSGGYAGQLRRKSQRLRFDHYSGDYDGHYPYSDDCRVERIDYLSLQGPLSRNSAGVLSSSVDLTFSTPAAATGGGTTPALQTWTKLVPTGPPGMTLGYDGNGL